MSLLPSTDTQFCFIDCNRSDCKCKNRNQEISQFVKLQLDYEESCNNYIKAFCEKHEIDFDFWVGDMPGTVAFFGDYSFNFTDIMWDINSNQPKEKIFEWFDFYLENLQGAINYYSYTKL